jgi:cyclomaltodextrinase
MLHHVDKNFGNDPDGDRKQWAREDPSDPSTWGWTSADKLFLKLVHEVHRRKMKIIIDGVFNHVGMTFWAMEDVRKNQQSSKYKDWFTITSWDDPATPANEFAYQGWFGVRELPELRKSDSLGMAEGPKEYIHAIVRRWMAPEGKPADGVDGWRLDAADRVPMAFWRDFRKWVRDINPDAYITGEVWWEDWKNDSMYNAAPWLKGDAFDAVMNYRWAREACRYFVDSARAISPTQFDRRLAAIRADYRADATAVLMNLYDSHDTDRLASRIVNPDLLYDHNVGLHDNRSYNPRKPREDELRIQKLMLLFQMTYVGAPMIYYGDEAGMWGGDDPDERKPMLWEDLRYDDEVALPFGGERPPDRNVFNRQLFAYYKALIIIRKHHEALSLGDFTTVRALDDRNIFAYERSAGAEKILVIINNSNVLQRVSLKDFSVTKAKLLFASVPTPTSSKSSTIQLQPKSGIIVAVQSA